MGILRDYIRSSVSHILPRCNVFSWVSPRWPRNQNSWPLLNLNIPPQPSGDDIKHEVTRDLNRYNRKVLTGFVVAEIHLHIAVVAGEREGRCEPFDVVGLIHDFHVEGEGQDFTYQKFRGVHADVFLSDSESSDLLTGLSGSEMFKWWIRLNCLY